MDVPGSNCTKTFISERVAGFSPELRRGRPSHPPTVHSQKPVLEFFGLRNFFQLFFHILSLIHPPLFIQVPPTTSLPRRRDLEKFSTFFSTTSSLYRKVVDVPGSNCTKTFISERVAGFSPELGRGRPSYPPTVHHQKPVLKFFGLRNFFQLFFSHSLSYSSAFIHPTPGDHVTTTSSGLRNFFQLFSFRSFSHFFIRLYSSKSRLHRHYPVVGT